jgi:hypothetical protein
MDELRIVGLRDRNDLNQYAMLTSQHEHLLTTFL